MVNDQTPSNEPAPAISVIVPAYNSSKTIEHCLDALIDQAGLDTEIVVVDDASSDSTREIVSRYPVKLVEMERNRGPGAARNRGVEVARGQILFFVDSDVTLADKAFERARRDMSEPGVDAVIGSYDDAPLHRSTVSLFKNLAHHHFHQSSVSDITTFWCACGLIRRDLFLKTGGFHEEIRGIEDVELGYRLAARGARIRLDPLLQVKHHKRWTFLNLLRTDLGLRALPWAAVYRKYGYLPRGLNFTSGQRVAAVLAMVLVISGLASVFYREAGILFLLCLTAAAWVNRALYGLFWRKGGLRLLIGGFLLQQFYYLYAAAGLAVGIARTDAAGLSSRDLANSNRST